MRDRDKATANEQREALFAAALWVCVVCGKLLSEHGTPQLAHRVPKTRFRLEAYGPEVMHHSLNLVPVCSLPCNSFVNIGFRSVEANALLHRIIRVVTGVEPEPNMRQEYMALREEFEEDHDV